MKHRLTPRQKEILELVRIGNGVTMVPDKYIRSVRILFTHGLVKYVWSGYRITVTLFSIDPMPHHKLRLAREEYHSLLAQRPSTDASTHRAIVKAKYGVDPL